MEDLVLSNACRRLSDACRTQWNRGSGAFERNGFRGFTAFELAPHPRTVLLMVPGRPECSSGTKRPAVAH